MGCECHAHARHSMHVETAVHVRVSGMSLTARCWLHAALLSADDGLNVKGKFLFRAKVADTTEFVLSVVYKNQPTHHNCTITGGKISVRVREGASRTARTPLTSCMYWSWASPPLEDVARCLVEKQLPTWLVTSGDVR